MATWSGVFRSRRLGKSGRIVPAVSVRLSKLLPSTGRPGTAARGPAGLRRSHHLYQNAIGVIPMPEYIAALGDIYTKVGNLDEARRQYELVEYIGKLSAINRVLYNRELAYFYADHDMKPLEGLELAKRELEYRKDIYAYDVVAWNLFRNGQFEAAGEAINQALKLGTKDAKLFYHAGMIFNRLGDKRKAKDYLGRALAINPHFHVLFADNAVRILRELEERDTKVTASEPSKGR